MCSKVCDCGYNCCIKSEKELLQIVQRTGAVSYTESSAAACEIERLFQMIVETSTRKGHVCAKNIVYKIIKQSKSFKHRLSTLHK